MDVTGIVLAAGAGTRFGGPKALATTADGIPWLALSTRLLRDAGCDRVVVVLGASAVEARHLLPVDAAIRSVTQPDWHRGMGHSLRAGLAAASGDAALIALVDMPDLPLEVVRRVLATGASGGTLTQAVFGGRPGHPVVIGRDHWQPAAATLDGDHGARGYLVAHGVTEVECGDLFDGRDVDAGNG